jgi:transposase InsO family protein
VVDCEPLIVLMSSDHRLASREAIHPREFVGEIFIGGSEKATVLGRKNYQSRNEARADVFDYIERFYNLKRRHSTLGYLSPADYEKVAHLG